MEKNNKLKVFIIYILTEPWNEIKQFPKIFRKLRYPTFWFYFFIFTLLLTLIQGDRLYQMISYFIVVFMFLWREYEKGEFWAEYRKKKYGKYLK